MNGQRQSSIENIISASEMKALQNRVRRRISLLLFGVLVALLVAALVSFQIVAEREMDRAAATAVHADPRYFTVLTLAALAPEK